MFTDRQQEQLRTWLMTIDAKLPLTHGDDGARTDRWSLPADLHARAGPTGGAGGGMGMGMGIGGHGSSNSSLASGGGSNSGSSSNLGPAGGGIKGKKRQGYEARRARSASSKGKRGQNTRPRSEIPAAAAHLMNVHLSNRRAISSETLYPHQQPQHLHHHQQQHQQQQHQQQQQQAPPPHPFIPPAAVFPGSMHMHPHQQQPQGRSPAMQHHGAQPLFIAPNQQRQKQVPPGFEADAPGMMGGSGKSPASHSMPMYAPAFAGFDQQLMQQQQQQPQQQRQQNAVHSHAMPFTPPDGAVHQHNAYSMPPGSTEYWGDGFSFERRDSRWVEWKINEQEEAKLCVCVSVCLSVWQSGSLAVWLSLCVCVCLCLLTPFHFFCFCLVCC